jgi:hypothetical protein
MGYPSVRSACVPFVWNASRATLLLAVVIASSKDCAVDVHCCADIGMSHHLLLCCYRRSHYVKPRAVRLPE